MPKIFKNNNQKKVWHISALESKNDEINKILLLSYTNKIWMWLYGMFDVSNTVKSAFILWFAHFLDSRAESQTFFCCFFWKFNASKGILELTDL
jgi:hypothetical protein